MVALVFVSLGRTLTMNIKKFILQLECDAYLLDKKFRDTMYSQDSLDHKDSLRGRNFMSFYPRYQITQTISS